MDILYPLGTGSVWENNELRYSLRSVAKNLKGLGQVWIIGERPDWLLNIRHIPMSDLFGIPVKNTYAKLRRACAEPELSDEFLYMNDDFFFLKPFNISDFPIFYRGNLPSGHRLTRRLSLNNKQNTTELLASRHLTTLDYDIHAPMRLEKLKVLNLPLDIKKMGACHPRSFYGNYYNLRGKYHKEVLVSPGRTVLQLESSLRDQAFFAIMTHAGKDWMVRKYIKNLWPTPSAYECAAS